MGIFYDMPSSRPLSPITPNVDIEAALTSALEGGAFEELEAVSAAIPQRSLLFFREAMRSLTLTQRLG